MAFTETQKTKLVRILRISRLVLDDHLDAVSLTSQDETDVDASITLFETARTSGHIHILGKKNPQGADVDFAEQLQQLREDIASVLHLDLSKASILSNRLLRG